MSPKQAYYEAMATRLAKRWEQDARMSERDSACWQQARDLDDALVRDRDDDTVTAKEYRVRCMDLLKLYETEQHQEGAA